MKVKLLNKPQLEFIDSAIGECYDKGCYTDISKRDERINKVANKMKHSSVLEFTDVIFQITASTKVLLEMTRHRHANYACKSSRYTINKSEIVFEKTGDDEIDKELENFKLRIIRQIGKGKKNDVVSLMLPQAYQYRWQVKFNYRSLQNFLQLRMVKSAHFHIRDVANEIFNQLPKEHKYLFEECVK
jgi:thymidylate synthase (FAD)